jgi:hypothetical protein
MEVLPSSVEEGADCDFSYPVLREYHPVAQRATPSESGGELADLIGILFRQEQHHMFDVEIIIAHL